MGVVYRAIDVREREVALKVIRSDIAADEEVRARFIRESEAVVGLQHRNVISIFECGVHDDSPYIAMELLKGTSLAARLASGTPLSLDSKLDIVIQLCEGLQFAHEHGVVHRDIKPANIWLLENGGVKILDFGLAKIAGSTLTHVGDLVGSAAYMSPEQLAGEQVDGRADIFAAGAVLYELLTGVHPFHADSVTATIHRILHEPPIPVHSLVPDLRPDLELAVDTALRKDVNARFDQAADFGAELRLARYGVTHQATDTVVSVRPPISPSEAASPPTIIARPQSLAPATRRGRASRRDLADRVSSPHTERRADQERSVQLAFLIDRIRGTVPHTWAWSGLVGLLLIFAVVIFRPAGPVSPPLVRLAVASTPPGASIALDGVESGQHTPALLTLAKRPGRIRLTLPGFEAADSLVPTEVKTDPQELRFTLRRVLRVQSEPSGAGIFFDGRDTGLVTPADVPVPSPSPGSIDLRLGERLRLSTPITTGLLDSGTLHVALTGRRSGAVGVADASQPKPPATALVSVHVTGGYPFEVSGCGTTSPASDAHNLEVRAPCSLRLRAPTYFLDLTRTIDAAGGSIDIAAPQLARVQLRSKYEWCTVILDGHAVGAPPIDLELVAGSYMAIIQCPDKTYSTRAVPIEPGRSIRRLDEFLR
jgi:hypothetical protein